MCTCCAGRPVRQFSLRFFARAALALTILLPLCADAASKFWDGSSDGNFANGANWVGGAAPVAGDDLVFQTGVTRLLVTNNFSPNRAFNTILFQGSNYVVRGNPLLVTNGVSSINPSGTNRIDADVDVRGSQPWEAQGALAVIDVNGDIDLNANTLTVRANTGDFFFSGVISGTGNLVKTNVGTLRLDGGTGHNTYSGFTRFDGGVLELNKFSVAPPTNYISIPGDITVGDGNGLVGTDVLRLFADDQIANTSDVTVRNSGRFDLNDRDDRIGTLTMQGGTVETGTGILFLGGNLTTMADVNTAFIEGRLSLGGASRTFDVNPGPPAADLRINAVISGDAISLLTSPGIIKTGGGSLFLAGTNTYNGITTVNDGQMSLLSDRALGAVTTALGGSAGVVVNGDANLFLSGVQVTNEDLTLNSSNPGGAFNASGASVWTGDIALSTDAFIASSGSLLLNGAISGSGGFTKLNTGSVTLAGTNANTYSGTTTVRDGTLLLDKDTTAVSDGAMSGPLVIGEEEVPANTDVVRYLSCCQLPDDTDITINASGLLDLNNFGENVSDIIFNGGDISTGAGSILPTGNITVNRNTNSQAIISGRMSVLSNPIIDVTGHFFSPDLSITAQLIGAGGFTKNGVGEIGLSGANTYSGLTTVNDGFLLVHHSSALGTTANGTVVNSGAVLGLNFGVAVGNEALTLAGTGQSSFGALSSNFGSNSWAGNITLSSNATISVDTGDFLNIGGSITDSPGPFDITKTGTGTLIFSGGTANSYDGTILVSGTLELAKTIVNASIPGALQIGDGLGGVSADVVRINSGLGQIANAAPITISGSGLLDINNVTELTGSISGSGRIDLGNGTLNAGNDGGTSTFSGLIFGTGNLTKSGNGNWTLTANNTYTGLTTIQGDGALIVDGSQPQSHVSMGDDANLGGDGVVGNIITTGGTISPGTYLPSPAILTCSNLSFGPGSFYSVDINGPTPGTGYDQLNVRGTNDLNGATLLLNVGSSYAPIEGDRLTIINNDGSEAIFGTFTGLPNGSLITAGGIQFRILYADIFANDVVLIVTNTALALGATPLVETGNGNGDIEPGECNLLQIVLSNKLGGIVSGVSATLSSTNPGVTITQPFSTYPNLPANGRRTNNTAFQISASPALACGTNIDLLLTVTTATNGTFTVPLTLYTGTAGSVLRFNRSGDQAIPDNGTLDSTITVSGVTSPLHHVVVSFHLSHTVDDNLDISLIGPDGTTVVLSSDNGGTFDDYGTSCADADRTTFSDAAAAAITSGTAPFRGTFRPEQPLAIYRGKFGGDVNGTWHLSVSDDTAAGLGTLHCWSISVFPSACTPGGGQCEQCDSPIIGSITPGDATQTDRLFRNSEVSNCSSNKICPGTSPEGTIRYDAYTFTNAGPAACVSVTLDSVCGPGGSVFSAAYLGSYNPANKCTNYLGDAGVSNPSTAYSFLVPSNSVFVVIVNEIDTGTGCTNYTLHVTGYECPQRLNIALDPSSMNRVILQWSTSALGYELISSTNVVPLGLYLPTGPEPVVVGGKYTVTNSVSGRRFYELRKP